jgi:hypothetical protein
MLAAKGTDGVAGAQGPAGVIGQTGPMGPSGPQGPAGAIGPTGPIGLAGPTGSAGPPGGTGLTGPAGPKGDTGAQGPVGPAGSGLSFKGEWTAGNIYEPGDVVLFHGTPYKVISAGALVSDILPPNDTSRFAPFLSSAPSTVNVYDVFCGSADPAQFSSVSQAIAALNLDGHPKTIQVHGACYENGTLYLDASRNNGNYDNLTIKGDIGASISFQNTSSYSIYIGYTKNLRLENLTIEANQAGGVYCFGMSSCVMTRVAINTTVSAGTIGGFYAGGASTGWLYSVEIANPNFGSPSGTGISIGRDSIVWLYGGSVRNFSTGISLLTNGSHVALLAGSSQYSYLYPYPYPNSAPIIASNTYGIRGISPSGGSTIEIFSGTLDSNATGLDVGKLNTAVLSSTRISGSSSLGIYVGAGSRLVFGNTNISFVGNSQIDVECSPFADLFGVLPSVNISSTCPYPKQ